MKIRLSFLKRIEKLCKKYDIKKYTILPDGRLDVDEDVNLSQKNLKKLPLSFRKVSGYFDCSHNQLTSLDGCPKEVGGSFYCFHNQLISLGGSPEEVGGDFLCSYNQLTSLYGSPEVVGRSFSCHSNQLTSLDGSPEVVGGWFNSSNNKKNFTEEDKRNAMERRKNLRLVRERVEFLKELLDIK